MTYMIYKRKSFLFCTEMCILNVPGDVREHIQLTIATIIVRDDSHALVTVHPFSIRHRKKKLWKKGEIKLAVTIQWKFRRWFHISYYFRPSFPFGVHLL